MSQHQTNDDFQPRPLFQRAGFVKPQTENLSIISEPISSENPASELAPQATEPAPNSRRNSAATRTPTEQIALRVPVEHLALWRASGPGWQTRMVKILCENSPKPEQA